MPFTNRNALRIFYLLAFYILIQTLWWGYHLMELGSTNELLKEQLTGTHAPKGRNALGIWMVVGEGFVFLAMLGFGFWQLQKYVRKELSLAQMEKTFLLSVTHEIKTPISALQLLTETALRHDLDKEQMRNILAQALEETEKLKTLTDNVLLATRLDQPRKVSIRETVDLSALLTEYVRSQSPRHRNGRINVVSSGPLLVTGDEQLLSLLISNLADNALKYSPEESPIELEAAVEDGSVVLVVRDHGPGIPAGSREKVFEKFYRLQESREQYQPGTGLGLYLAKNIARMHGADISLEENRPQGTIVRVRFVKNEYV